MKIRTVFLILVAAILAVGGLAVQNVLAEDSKLQLGGDIRLRDTSFDDIPYSIGTEARGGQNHFQRYRTRIWGKYKATDNFNLGVRAVNEFRTWIEPNSQAYEFPDEVVFDNLYAEWKTSLMSLKVGRQDMIYGTGKLILDGTPKDGSRTIYFNAVKASYTAIPNTSIDFLAMYTPADDDLAINSQNYDIVGKRGSSYGGDEVGGGIYVKNASYRNLPFEAYYLVKTDEQTWARPGSTPGAGITHNAENVHTVGTRLMPKFSDALSGNLEMAYQFGDDISAYMIDGLVTWMVPSMEKYKTKLGLGWYYVSGDDPTTSDEEGWNPLWARWPQYSELFVYSFDVDGVGYWSNVSLPHVDFSISPCTFYQADFLLGYMMAPEKDTGLGSERGLLFTWWNKFTIKEKIFSDVDKLAGHVLLEVFDPGDYYAANLEGDTACFFRVDLTYSF